MDTKIVEPTSHEDNATNTKCDICVTNQSTVELHNVVAKYWQSNSITGHPGEKLAIADGITLDKNEESPIVKNVSYDSTPNPRYDHWSISFEFSGEKYQYKDKRCNIAPEDNNQLVKVKVTGSPKKGFKFHVDMPKSSSCSGSIS
ncbi:hypothetical protein [Salinivibrio proteolyticus]|uniref:Uncharacterized protein n=1 Tax=Salinivibrio proteolyticus TaxID=334715 RepID=A0ABY7L9Y7_9GAMM|nr:hypothetical protein [Salinivibrio proteolyticus]WBA13888.1 hypothetical protein N7E60_09110 [Salinivibrio proteolyticus]